VFTRDRGGNLTLVFKGIRIGAHDGESVATALLAAGFNTTRTSVVSGEPRGPFCMMGACFECLAVVDGVPGVQTCMTPVRDGMRIEPQEGARGIGKAAVVP
jgi:predicted molibdopterin-dependent oxidoreductase YjgC